MVRLIGGAEGGSSLVTSLVGRGRVGLLARPVAGLVRWDGVCAVSVSSLRARARAGAGIVCCVSGFDITVLSKPRCTRHLGVKFGPQMGVFGVSRVGHISPSNILPHPWDSSGGECDVACCKFGRGYGTDSP